MHSSGPDDRSKEPLATIRGFRTGGSLRADRCSSTREESWCLQNNLGEGSKGLARAARWERKESLGRSLAGVHLPDMCKIRVPPSAPENRKNLKQEEIKRQSQQEVAWGLPGKQPRPLACHNASAYAMRGCRCPLLVLFAWGWALSHLCPACGIASSSVEASNNRVRSCK